MRRWIAVVALMGLVVTACGGGDDSAVDVSGCEPGATDGDLVFYNWAEYIDPDLIDAFEAQYGINVEYTEYASNEEMLAQVEAGAAAYDLVVPSDYMVDTMRQEGLLVELNMDAIPNRVNVDPDFLNLPFDPEGKFHLPYQWGTTGIAVNTAVVGEDFPRSWELIFAPEWTTQYNVSLLDDAPETVLAALHYRGYTLEQVVADNDVDKIREAEEVLSTANENVLKYDSINFGDDLITGEVDIAHGWSGGFFTAFFEAENPDDYVYFIPEEGGTSWVDTMAIPVTAEHPCSAHTMINFLLDAENGAQLTNWTYYASPNAAAEAFILPEILEDEGIYPGGIAADNLEFIPQTGEMGLEIQDAFTRSKG